MTSTPAYGFRISKGAGGGPMQTAMQAGDIKSIQDLLAERYPALKFETLSEETEQVDKPDETVGVPTAPVTEAPKEETTASLFEDYMANLPAVTRPLVTTDYKGVRGGRLGEGNYTTASIIPGAQVSTPAPAPTPAPSTGGGTTYNAPVIGGDWQQFYGDYYGGDVNYGTIGYGAEDGGGAPSASTDTSTAAAARGLTPAWAKKSAQQSTTAKKASAGLVPSTTQRGTYVAPTSPEASRAAAGAAQRIETAVSAGQGMGVKAAAGSDKRMGAQAAAALIAAPGSDRKAAERALKQEKKGNVELTNQAKKALKKAADKKKNQ